MLHRYIVSSPLCYEDTNVNGGDTAGEVDPGEERECFDDITSILPVDSYVSFLDMDNDWLWQSSSADAWEATVYPLRSRVLAGTPLELVDKSWKVPAALDSGSESFFIYRFDHRRGPCRKTNDGHCHYSLEEWKIPDSSFWFFTFL